jgi:hypothetical protein
MESDEGSHWQLLLVSALKKESLRLPASIARGANVGKYAGLGLKNKLFDTRLFDSLDCNQRRHLDDPTSTPASGDNH